MTVFGRMSDWFLRERWTMGLLPDGNLADLVAGRPLPEPIWSAELPDGYLADPFPLTSGGLIAEHYSFAGLPGRLVEVVWSGRGAPVLGSPGPTSEAHLSYPSSFSHDGEQWCVPESAADGRVALWKRSGDGWSVVAELLDVPAVDPDLVQHDGRWWLFFGVEGDHRNDELHLAWSDSLEGPFTLHPGNPVVRDVTASRGAGRPFVVDGTLYRPAQDCSRAYGGAVTICEVKTLSTEDYAQKVIRRLAPRAPYRAGLHTLNLVEGGLLIDGKRMELARGDVLSKVRRRLRG